MLAALAIRPRRESKAEIRKARENNISAATPVNPRRDDDGIESSAQMILAVHQKDNRAGSRKYCTNIKKIRRALRRKDRGFTTHSDLNAMKIPQRKDGNRLGLRARREMIPVVSA